MILAYYLRDTKGVFSTPSIESGSINISSISIVSTRLAACARVQLSRALSSAKKPESPIAPVSNDRELILNGAVTCLAFRLQFQKFDPRVTTVLGKWGREPTV